MTNEKKITYNEIIELIEIIKYNIELIKDVIPDETIFELKEKLSSKQKIHFKIKEKEDITLNQIRKKLEKIKYSKDQIKNTPELIEKTKETYQKLELSLNGEYKLINYCRNLRIKEIENLEIKIKEEEEKNNNFEKDKKLIIEILESFIYSLNINNLKGTYTKEYIYTNIFQSFLDNKSPINPKIDTYFKPIIKEYMFDYCIFFKSTIQEVKKLLLEYNIQSILIDGDIEKKIHIK